jgi:hypothetical protein
VVRASKRNSTGSPPATIPSENGLSNIADQSRQNDGNVLPVSAQPWEGFLNDEVGVLLPLKLASAIAKRVTQFNTAAQLATINPRAAYVYVEQCAMRRS